MPKTIYMGLNTDPIFELSEGSAYSQKTVDFALDLKKQIHEVMEAEGECDLSWECTGRTRHEIHAHNWAHVLPEYNFAIDYQSYGCRLTKKVEG